MPSSKKQRVNYLEECEKQTGAFHIMDINAKLRPSFRMTRRQIEHLLNKQGYECVGHRTWQKQENGGKNG